MRRTRALLLPLSMCTLAIVTALLACDPSMLENDAITSDELVSCARAAPCPLVVTNSTSTGASLAWELPRDTSRFGAYVVRTRPMGASAWTVQAEIADEMARSIPITGLHSETSYDARVDQVSQGGRLLGKSNVVTFVTEAESGGVSDAGASDSTSAPPVNTPPTPDAGSPDAWTPTGAPLVRVSGNRLVDQSGSTVQLHGVNRSGAEYACAEGWGIRDGPTDDDTSIGAMKAWNVNAVRLPMNEACWLGINGVKAAYGGASYRNAMVSYVNRLNAHGIVVILNLHFSGPGSILADDMAPMADRDHSNDFWAGVASVFQNNHSVLFDLFNEPYPDSNRDSTAAWSCVRNGGTCPGVNFVAAGMQEMLDAVRGTGATQPIMIGGPQYAGVVDRWLEYAPSDPLQQLVASIHIYGLPLDAPCRLASCWDSDMATLAATTPIVIGELGDTDCTSKFSPPLMTWADAHGVSYTAWAWNVGSCAGDPSLLTSYTGTPTAYGAGVRDHLLKLP